MNLNDIFHVITGVCTVVGGWLINKYKKINDDLEALRTRDSQLETRLAVAENDIENLDQGFDRVSNRLDSIDHKMNEILSFLPLLKEALQNIREMRNPNPRP